MERNKTHLQIGVIARPHGVRGELKVRLHCEESESLQASDHLVVESTSGTATRYKVESVRGSAKGPILRLESVDSMEAADALRSSKLWVERASMHPLEPGEYYLVDLVGCSVFFEEEKIATVTSVRPDPSVDTMILKMKSGELAELPIVAAWVGKVDTTAQSVELLTRDGLIL